MKGKQQSAATTSIHSNCDNSPSGHVSKAVSDYRSRQHNTSVPLCPAPPMKLEQGNSQMRKSVILYSPSQKQVTEKHVPQSNTPSCKEDQRKAVPAKVSMSQNGFVPNHLSCRSFFLERRSAKRKQSLDSASLNSYFSKRPENGIPLNGVITSLLNQGKNREEHNCLRGKSAK